ncbi:hypothetical protein CPB83DRAFT_863686 [Crepidotus variabilis]|uniref:DUF1996 domain-containing protein n=1 Tax=Crepidotus variabilis TaxID=179855 RepID=A0A9P6JJ62_9AGAR|nr:hypothetical protein CPB83DRAFT_863686 [Crepidotus variabilis]
MRWNLVLGVSLLSSLKVHGLIRFGCSQLVTERFDPLVTPGKVSPHVHQVVGGNAFNLTMDPANDLQALSTCTTCRFKEDKSNYWTATLYFKHPNGSFIRVNQMANHNTGPGLQSGGMTIYYFQPTGKFSIFPKGFRMTVGNAQRRSGSSKPANGPERSLSFRCFGSDPYNMGDGTPGSGSTDSFDLPKQPCAGGIRSNIYFPTCWDGKNTDSPDHQSHVAAPAGGPMAAGCPSTHPVVIPQLFMEIVWDTRPFNDKALWPKDGSQPFVFSMGDPYGFGQHADYVFGWEGDSLKRAMDQCTSGTGIPWDCKALTLQDVDTMNQCRQPVKVEEPVEAQWLPQLPGCNPIQSGPSPATVVSNCAAASTTLTFAPSPTVAPVVVTPPWTVCNANGNGAGGIEPNCNAYPGPTTAKGFEATPAPTVTPL